MQAKSTPIREAVILLPDDDNDKNLENLLHLTTSLKSVTVFKHSRSIFTMMRVISIRMEKQNIIIMLM